MPLLSPTLHDLCDTLSLSLYSSLFWCLCMQIRCKCLCLSHSCEANPCSWTCMIYYELHFKLLHLLSPSQFSCEVYNNTYCASAPFKTTSHTEQLAAELDFGLLTFWVHFKIIYTGLYNIINESCMFMFWVLKCYWLLSYLKKLLVNCFDCLWYTLVELIDPSFVSRPLPFKRTLMHSK